MSVTIINELIDAYGTKIIDKDGIDLCKILGVESIEVQIKANKVNRAKIYIGLVKTEIKCGDTEWLIKHPISGKFEKMSSIWFADGTSVVFNDNEVTVHNNDGIVKLNLLGSDKTYKFKEAK